jgi:hypothetical protein
MNKLTLPADPAARAFMHRQSAQLRQPLRVADIKAHPQMSGRYCLLNAVRYPTVPGQVIAPPTTNGPRFCTRERVERSRWAPLFAPPEQGFVRANGNVLVVAP